MPRSRFRAHRKEEDAPPAFDASRLLYQGKGLAAVDKPAGLPVHRGMNHPWGLAEILDAQARGPRPLVQVEPGWTVAPVHRLDLEASGVVLMSLAREAAQVTQLAISAGEMKKRYLAYVAGPLPEEGSIEGPVRSKLRGVYRYLPARLDYRRLAGDERLSLVEVLPVGGRTHQIRSLFAGIGRPLAGDLRYGKPKPARQFLDKFKVPYLLLHAREIELPPTAPGGPLCITAPFPDAFIRVAAAKGWQLPET